jgi:hypothetical protein
MANLTIIKQLFKTKWPTNIIATPTFYEPQTLVQNVGADHIVCEDVSGKQPPIDYLDRYSSPHHVWKFTCKSTTRQNIEDMIDAILYVRNNYFYPGGFCPEWNDDSTHVLCHMGLNEGSGNPADSSDNNHDFTLGAGALDNPVWKTDGTPWQKNYLRFEGDVTADGMTTGTLLDTAPDEFCLEIVFKLVSGFWTAVSTNNYEIFTKVNDSSDHYKLAFLGATDRARMEFKVESSTTYLQGSTISEENWHSLMVSVGDRGQELFLDGRVIQQTVSVVNPPGAGTDEDFVIQASTVAAADYDLVRLRVSDVQRLPYDKFRVSEENFINTRKGVYQATVMIDGQLFNVRGGGKP